jgi:hypothetical protein
MHDHGGRRTPARPPRRRRRLYLAGLVGALALTLGVAACGGGGKTGGVASLSGANKPTATTAGGSSNPRQAALAFARCMRQHGIDMPDPTFNGNAITQKLKRGPGSKGPDDPKFKAAQQACKQYLPNGGAPEKVDPQRWQQLLAFARCMRQHGINMPDPKPGGGIEIKGGPGGVNPDSPTFKAAQQACQQYEPHGGKKQEQSSGGGK